MILPLEIRKPASGCKAGKIIKQRTDQRQTRALHRRAPWPRPCRRAMQFGPQDVTRIEDVCGLLPEPGQKNTAENEPNIMVNPSVRSYPGTGLFVKFALCASRQTILTRLHRNASSTVALLLHALSKRQLRNAKEVRIKSPSLAGVTVDSLLRCYQYATLAHRWTDFNSLDCVSAVTSGTVGALNENDAANQTAAPANDRRDQYCQRRHILAEMVALALASGRLVTV
jgi:hypothetical protein